MEEAAASGALPPRSPRSPGDRRTFSPRGTPRLLASSASEAEVDVTAVGSKAGTTTPMSPASVASTLQGSAALGPTPPSGRATLRFKMSPRLLSLSPEMDSTMGDAQPHPPGSRLLSPREPSGRSPCPALPSGMEDLLVSSSPGRSLPAVRVSICSPSQPESPPVRTPMAHPLSPGKLLPPSAPARSDSTAAPQVAVVDTGKASGSRVYNLSVTPRPSILGPRPTASAPVRRKKGVPEDFVPRRSARINKGGDGMNKGPFHKAQTVLLRRMGALAAEEQISNEAFEEYIKMFDKPLAPHQIKAIAALFDPDGVEFDEPAHANLTVFSIPETVQPCGA